jgi:glycosyltransferase involved in cell wall biosynthesis
LYFDIIPVMRILFFSPYFYPYISGITTYSQTVLSHLATKHDVEVLTFPHKKDLPKKELFETETSQFTISRIPYLFKISKGYISPQSIFTFWNSLSKADLVILNIPNFEGLILAILALLKNRPVLSIAHCHVILPNNVPSKIIKFALNLSISTQLLLSKKIIAYTKDYINSIPLLARFKNKMIFTNPPIKKPQIDTTKYGEFTKMKGNKTWIGYSGRISQEKGLEYLIQAIHKLKDKNIELIFAGPYGKDVAGENDYYEKIIKLLNKSNIPYHMLGKVSYKELGAFYKSIDLLVLPSISQTEAFGIVQVEAIMSGTPVISTDLPGVRTVIKTSKMGIVVKPQSAIELKNAIKEIVNNKKQYSNKTLIEKAINTFNMNKTFKKFNDLINNL